MTFWDQRFSEPGFKYGTEPNAFLRQAALQLAPGSTVLVPGDGEGRNGVWLAGQGHVVTSVDDSAVGLQKAQAQARGLKAGGCMVIEAFHPQQLQHSSGGPKEVGMLYTPEQLAAEFEGMLKPLLA